MEMIKKDYRFKAKDILKDSSRLVAYGMLTNFFKDMSQINDINYFIQIMQSKTIKEKQEIEDGIIYLTSKIIFMFLCYFNYINKFFYRALKIISALNKDSFPSELFIESHCFFVPL